MVDFHSHFLPSIDDGARDVHTALEMLVNSKEQGVDTIIATPHFYADGRTVEGFLYNREQSYNRIMEAAVQAGADIPDIVLASEVRLGYSILELENISELCIGDSDYMLVEMPYEVWTPEVYDLLYIAMIKFKIKPVMAHIERYIKVNKKIESYNKLFDLGVMVQANAEGFLDFSERRFLSKIIKSGNVHVLGSDMHNMSDRSSRIGEAVRKIEKKFGSAFLSELESNARNIILSK